MPGLETSSGAGVDDAVIQDFRARHRGELIQPGDPGYEAARRIWNASIDEHPGLIARCSGVGRRRRRRRPRP